MKVAFDIDDTLMEYRPEFQDFVPDYQLIEIATWHWYNGDGVFAWSGGGVEYTKNTLKRLGLNTIMTAIPKTPESAASFAIDLCYDDMPNTLTKLCIKVNRNRE